MFIVIDRKGAEVGFAEHFEDALDLSRRLDADTVIRASDRVVMAWVKNPPPERAKRLA